MISILNYGSGNTRAILNIYDNLNIKSQIISTPNEIKKSKKIILPGVGSFDYNMSKLIDNNLIDSLNEMVLVKKIPFLGICLGMQILLDKSEEGSLKGLGWIKGKVRKFDVNKDSEKIIIPHLGWNSIEIFSKHSLFDGVNCEKGYYFIHNYFADLNDKKNILTMTNYFKKFVSGIHKENIFGVQFHPEKSHNNGVCFLKNFSKI